MLGGTALFICSSRVTQHTFADAHPISEDPCCVLGEAKLLNGDGAQLSLNQTKTKHWKHYCDNNKRANKSYWMWKNKRTNLLSSLRFWFFLEREIWENTQWPLLGKIHHYITKQNDVISDLMVSLFLSLFNVFKGLFSFTRNWMSLNSLLFDTNSIYRYSHIFWIKMLLAYIQHPFLQQTYQVKQLLSSSHFAEKVHGVKGDTVSCHQFSSLCKYQPQPS